MSAFTNDSMFNSESLKPTMVFMSGKLKLEGNMGKAMALEKLMGKMQKRGFHSLGVIESYDGKEPVVKSRL